MIYSLHKYYAVRENMPDGRWIKTDKVVFLLRSYWDQMTVAVTYISDDGQAAIKTDVYDEYKLWLGPFDSYEECVGAARDEIKMRDT